MVEGHKDYHIFRDPIHGFIRVNDFEREIINSRPFQRLRYIKQLALTNLVYHGADHTRFAHSLGMMEFATRIFDTLMLKEGEYLRDYWNDNLVERNRQLLRIACLVHDTGHAPFSHVSEILFPNGMTHEQYSAEITTSSPIREIIDEKGKDLGIDSAAVRDIIAGETLAETAFLREIISGDLDADRMDYLLRDSYYTGVYYGKFDYERLIHTFTLKKEEEGAPVLAIEEGGKHAAEALILARYFMFTQVYFHKVRRIYDLHLSDFIKEALNDGVFPSKIEEYLEWDDLKVFGLLKEKAREGDNIAKRILTRKHYECVFETSEHPASGEEIDRFRSMSSAVKERYSEEDVKEDTSANAPHKFRKAEFFLKMRTGDANYARIDEKSDIIKGLRPIYQRRLYVGENLFEEVSEFCKQYTEKHELKYD